MDKKSKEIIKETIYFLLKVRSNRQFTQEFGENLNGDCYSSEKVIFRKYILQDYKNNGLANIVDENSEYIDDLDKQLISLNSILDKKDKVQEVVNLEQQIKKIQAKKNITVKEFSEIYNVSKTSQQNYRGRLHDPLPYHQKVQGGKIVYNVDEVEKWFENQHK